MTAYLIVGAGKFGRQALRRLREREPHAAFTLVDRDSLALTEARNLVEELQMAVADGPEFVAAHLTDLDRWDYILPCLPVHLAAAALARGPLAPPLWEEALVPEELARLAPVAFRGRKGELYLSRAAHLCPDECQEPEVCPVDGLPRRPPLHRLLADASLPGWGIRVLSSLLLAPGVGGFPAPALAGLAHAPKALPPRLLIATACSCHGVVTAFVRPGGRT